MTSLNKPRIRIIKLVNGQTILEDEDDLNVCANSGSLGESEMVKILAKYQITMEKPTDKLKDIVGLEEEIQNLQPNFLSATRFLKLKLAYPEKFRFFRQHTRTFLLYGHPEARKYELVKALAGEYGNTLFYVDIYNLLPKWRSGEQIDSVFNALFTLAALKKPSIIYIDNLELLSKGTKDRTDEPSMANICYRCRFKSRLDGEHGEESKQVIIVGATSDPGKIDVSLFSRFSVRIRVKDGKSSPEIEQFYQHESRILNAPIIEQPQAQPIRIRILRLLLNFIFPFLD